MNDNENDFIQMIKDTGKLIADRKINDLSSRAIALRENNVDDNVKILRCLNKSFQTKQNNQIALSDVNLKTFSLKMSKSGLNGCIYGMTKEMLYSFKAWKN